MRKKDLNSSNDIGMTRNVEISFDDTGNQNCDRVWYSGSSQPGNSAGIIGHEKLNIAGSLTGLSGDIGDKGLNGSNGPIKTGETGTMAGNSTVGAGISKISLPAIICTLIVLELF